MPYFQSRAGKQIYYERHGHSGPVIILIHGLASSTRIWIKQVRILKKYCQVYTFDFPGHGKSEWQSTYSISELSELPQRLMDDCHISRASVVAISLGCLVALDFAARYPDRIDKLVLEGPMGNYIPWWNPSGWPDLTAYFLLPIFLYVSIRIFGYQATALWINTYGIRGKRNVKVLEAVQNQTDFRAIRQLLWDSACWRSVGPLTTINTPILLIRGQNDPMPPRFSDDIRAKMPHVTYWEVPNARHLVALEKPGEFNARVISFLNLKLQYHDPAHS